MTLSAVITADIVNSTRLSKNEMKKLMKSLETLFMPHQFEFFRGDSFQVYLKDPEEALPVVLQARTAAIRLGTEGFLSDIRASIGIGAVKLPVRSLTTASGEAFLVSGRSFDTMTPEQRLLIAGGEKNAAANLGLQVTARFIDYLFQRLTSKQAAVIFELMQKRTQVETARKLKKSQATVHKHIQSAGWTELEKNITAYKNIVATLES
jgi:hypothetical protein